MPETKLCLRCGRTKNTSDFCQHKNRHDGLQVYCKACEKTYRQSYYLKNRERIIERTTQYHLAHPEQKIKASKSHAFRKKYNITIDQRDAQFEKQGRRCAICKTADCDSSRDWHTDHNHQNGEFRGILCWRCNSALGFVKENPNTLMNMILYLAQS